MMPTPADQGRPSAAKPLPPSSVLPLVAAAAIGLYSAAHLPVFDDEANAIVNSSKSLSSILAAGGQFHPPGWELILRCWQLLMPAGSPFSLRLLAVILWLATILLLRWTLAPLTSSGERTGAAWAVALLPAHLALPFAATWYALGAFLSVWSFGLLLRLVGPAVRVGRWGWLGLFAVLMLLAAVTYAWPVVVVCELLGVAVILGRERLRAAAKPLALVFAVLAGLNASALFARLPSAVHQRAGGEPRHAAGAFLALLAGHSAPAVPWLLAIIVVLVVAGALVALRRSADRSIAGLWVAAAATLAGLALTNTLNDKRLLLASPLAAAGLGICLARHGVRAATALLALSAAPAWLGWLGIDGAPWIAPRWQDPIGEVARRHAGLERPHLLTTDHPAVAYEVARIEGGDVWQSQIETAGAWSTARWGLSAARVAAPLIERRRGMEPPLRCVDVVFTQEKRARALDLVRTLKAAGWAVVSESALGVVDPFARLRHGGEDGARLTQVILSRPVP
jgi:hypothetical protein